MNVWCIDDGFCSSSAAIISILLHNSSSFPLFGHLASGHKSLSQHDAFIELIDAPAIKGVNS